MLCSWPVPFSSWLTAGFSAQVGFPVTRALPMGYTQKENRLSRCCFLEEIRWFSPILQAISCRTAAQLFSGLLLAEVPVIIEITS